METTMVAPIVLTDGAIKEIKRLMNEPGFDSSKYLRIGVKVADVQECRIYSALTTKQKKIIFMKLKEFRLL